MGEDMGWGFGWGDTWRSSLGKWSKNLKQEKKLALHL